MDSNLGQPPRPVGCPKGHRQSVEHRLAISRALRGKPKTKIHILHASQARKGRGSSLVNEKHHAWRGDRVGYCALHDWVRRRIVIPTCCEDCGAPDKITSRLTSLGKRIPKHYLHLCNISGEYMRDLLDWKYLCPKCHSALDKGRDSIRKVFRDTKRPPPM